MIDDLPPSWRDALGPVLRTGKARQLQSWLGSEEAAGKAIYPPGQDRLRAFALTPLDAVKVVVLGQDPYHGPGQANGLAFAVADRVRLPPSLANIYKELRADCGIEPAASGNLEGWARQGVLLLNTCLSVEAGCAASHAGKGWEAITDAALAAVADRAEPSVFILWGNHAQAKARAVPRLAATGPHLVLAAPHPSPLSAHRGFFGSRPFSQANAFLRAHGRTPIAW